MLYTKMHCILFYFLSWSGSSIPVLSPLPINKDATVNNNTETY